MKDKFYFIDLFLTYRGLLTEKQREIFDMHFLMDLSLSEIAEEKGITRQNVSDTVKSTKEKLAEYENLLKIKEKTDKIITLCEKEPSALSEKIKEIIK